MSWQQVLSATAIAALVSSTVGSRARADFDVYLTNVGGQVHTGGIDDGTEEIHATQTIFDYEFQEEPSDPYNIGDPGFNAPAGSGLTAGSAMAFDILGPGSGSVLPYNLSYWDGNGPVSWGTTPAGETITLNLGLQSRTAGAGTDLVSGFTLQTIDVGGNMHKHLLTSLLGSDGNSIPAGPGDWGTGDGVQPADGIYAIALSLHNGAQTASEPIYLIFNNGLGDEAVEAAIAAVPEPATSVLFALGVATVAAIGRRRFRRGANITRKE